MNSSEFNYYTSNSMKSAKVPNKGKRYSGSTIKAPAKGAAVTHYGNRRNTFIVPEYLDYKFDKPKDQPIRKTSNDLLKEIENVSTTSCDEDHSKQRATVICEGVPVYDRFDHLEKKQNDDSQRYFSQSNKFQGPCVKGLPLPTFL
jgi:hypothetical protein